MSTEALTILEPKISALVKESSKIRRRLGNLETFIIKSFSRVFELLQGKRKTTASLPNIPFAESPSFKKPSLVAPFPENKSLSEKEEREISSRKDLLEEASPFQVPSSNDKQFIRLNLNYFEDQENSDRMENQLKKEVRKSTRNQKRDYKERFKSQKEMQRPSLKRKQGERMRRNSIVGKEPFSCSVSPYSKKSGRRKREKEREREREKGHSFPIREGLSKHPLNIFKIEKRNKALKNNFDNVNSRLENIKKNADELKSKLSESFQDQMDFLDELSWDIKAFEEKAMGQKTPDNNPLRFNHPKLLPTSKAEIPREINLRQEVWQSHSHAKRSQPRKSLGPKQIPSLNIDSEKPSKKAPNFQNPLNATR